PSGAARDEPRAPREAAGEREPRPGQGDVTAAAGRPPQAAGEQSRDEPWVTGEDDEGLPAPRVATAGATADPVKDYFAQVGQVPLLTAGQEVELAKRIEAGLFAEQSRTTRLPVHLAEATSTLARVQRQLLQDLGREPTPDELAAGLDMTPQKLIEVQKHAREPISLHTPLGEDGDSELGDLIEDS